MLKYIFPEDEMKPVDYSKRISGGNSFASAMMRKNLNTRAYAKAIIKLVIEKNGLFEEEIECFFTDTFFIITKKEKILIIKGYNFVEYHRQQGVYSFDSWIEDLLKND